MTTLVNLNAGCACLGGGDAVAWSNVTGGAISLTPSASSVLIATFPLTTGSVPLTTGLWAVIWMSWLGKSATAGKFSVAERRMLYVVKGDAMIANYLVYNNATLDSNALLLPAPPTSFAFDGPNDVMDFVQFPGVINGSGDLEISMHCLVTDNTSHAGVNWDFTGLTAEYRIIGCE